MKSRTFWSKDWNHMSIKFYVDGSADIRKGETTISLTKEDLKVFIMNLDAIRMDDALINNWVKKNERTN